MSKNSIKFHVFRANFAIYKEDNFGLCNANNSLKIICRMINFVGSFLLKNVLFTQKFGKALNKLQRKINCAGIYCFYYVRLYSTVW